jgi:integrase
VALTEIAILKMEGKKMAVETILATTKLSRPRRERGEGRLWKIGRIWWIQYYVHGRRVRESSGSKTETVASRLLKRRLGEVGAGVITPASVQRLRYENMREALLADYRTNNRRSLYRNLAGEEQVCGLKHLDALFNGYRAVDITTDLVREFIGKRQADGAPNSTINRSLAALRRMFFLAKGDGKLRDVPHIPMLKEPPARKGFLDQVDFQRLRLELPEHLRPVLTLGFYTGMRLGEIKRLRWSNVSLLDSQIRLDPGTTKNDEPRLIPLMGELPEMLRILRRQDSESEFVFTRGKRPIGSFRKAWSRACVDVGLARFLCRTCNSELDRKRNCPSCGIKVAVGRAIYDGLIFHDLRRTGVRNLVRAGVPERVAQAISGHKTRAVFERYNIVSERDLKDAGRKLETYLADQNGANSGQVEKASTMNRVLTN